MHLDFTALGDSVNTTARLASQAGSGDILISNATCTAAGLDMESLKRCRMELKGKSEPIGVHALRGNQGSTSLGK